MIDKSKCKHLHKVPYGSDRDGEPRWKCKECSQTGFYEAREKRKPSWTKEAAIWLLVVGLTNRQIAEELNVSHVTIGNWLKSLRKTHASFEFRRKVAQSMLREYIKRMKESDTPGIASKKQREDWQKIDPYVTRAFDAIEKKAPAKDWRKRKSPIYKLGKAILKRVKELNELDR